MKRLFARSGLRRSTINFVLFHIMKWGTFPLNMANANPPVVIAQGIGQIARSFLREVGSVFWFIMHTFEETFERIQRGRVPFRAVSVLRTTDRPAVDSC